MKKTAFTIGIIISVFVIVMASLARFDIPVETLKVTYA